MKALIIPSAQRRKTLALTISATLALGLAPNAGAGDFPAIVPLSTMDGDTGFRLDGGFPGWTGSSGYSYGAAVSNAGDMNGDGIDDLLIGGPLSLTGGGGVASGSSYVVFGKDTATVGPFAATQSLMKLNGSDGFSMNGAEGHISGHAVSAAGDINGDGIDDVLIGAPNASPNGTVSGSSFVVFGKDTATVGDFPAGLALADLNGADGFRLDGAAGGDTSGTAVSNVGDVNGDGIDDLLIGAPKADPNGGDSGSSYVVFGRDTETVGDFPATLALADLNGTNGFRLDGVASSDLSGSAVSGAGDINGDGIDDLLIGAPNADPNGSNSGSSYVVFGRDTAAVGDFPAALPLTDLNGTNGFRLDGTASPESSGYAVSTAGDVNGDGIDDLLIGAPGAGPNGFFSGSSYVVFGRDTETVGDFPATLALASLNGTNGFRLDGGATDDYSGFAVSAAGDFNGDGIDDVLIGARRADPNGSNSGSTYVVFGRETATAGDFPATLALADLNGITGFRLDGVAAGDQSGSAVSAAGDINGDGIDDLLIGAPDADPHGTDSGSGYVVFGGVGGPGLVPVPGITPATLNFGDVAVGVQVSEILTVENLGDGTLQPGTVTITGPHASDFSIEMNNCTGAQLAGGESCSIEIGFTPIDSSIRQASLQFDSNAPSSPEFVDLRGNNDAVFEDDFEG